MSARMAHLVLALAGLLIAAGLVGVLGMFVPTGGADANIWIWFIPGGFVLVLGVLLAVVGLALRRAATDRRIEHPRTEGPPG